MFSEPFWFFANYDVYERPLSSTMISLAMLGMGASLTPREFAGVFVDWRGFGVGMVTQIVLVPLWAGILLALTTLIPSDVSGLAAADAAGIALGIALIAAMPGGSASNMFTHLGNGNVALSVALTAITTFVCLVTTPIVVDVLIAFQFPGTLSVDPLRIVRDIALFLIVPLVAGMALRPVLRSRQPLFTTVAVRMSLLILGLIVIGSLGAGRIDIFRYGWAGPAALVVFGLVMQQIANLASLAAGLTESDRLAIIIEVTLKNMLVALLLLTSMFPREALVGDPDTVAAIVAARDGCTYAVLFYGGLSLFLGAVSVLRRRAILGGRG